MEAMNRYQFYSGNWGNGSFDWDESESYSCYIHSSDDDAYAAVLETVYGDVVSVFAGCVVAVALCTVK